MANYKVIGSDQKQYGPVSTEDLRKWIAQGRLDAQTKVQIEGSAEWKSLAEIPELEEALRNRVPPPPLASPSASSRTSALAVTSLVLGVLGAFTCGITALFGLVLGIIAMVKISNSRGTLRGGGIALAGVIVSGIFMILIPFFAAMMLPALVAAKQKAQAINCVSNEKQLALAVRIYAGDHDGQFPPATTWCDAIQTDVGVAKVFKCVAAHSTGRCDYAFNAKLGGLNETNVAPDTVMIFESDGDWNRNGSFEQMIDQPRHARVFVVAFADGSVQQLRESQMGALRWNP
jgi:hypothetical protein